MNAGGEGDLQLRAHAIGAGHEDRIPPALAIELKERAEAADRCKYAAASCFSRHGGDPPLGLISDRNIDAGIGVAHERSSFPKGLGELLDPRICGTDGATAPRPGGSAPPGTCRGARRCAPAPKLPP